MNIVVMICHDLGQYLGCYGEDAVRSPNIDAFAKTGMRFEKSFCCAPQCSPSRAGLWTGRFPHANGVVGLTHHEWGNDLNPDEKHLVEILDENGYDSCLCGVQHEASGPERCGYQQVFPGNWAATVADNFEKFVSGRKEGDKPFFAQLGTMEPHRSFHHDPEVEVLPHDSMNVPGYLPDIPVIREDLADMEASVNTVDRAFKRVLDALRASPFVDDTVVVFTADHGIPFTHAKMTLYDPGLEVPFIIAGPGIPQGVVRQEMISNVDVFPTLLDLLNIQVPSNLHGRSFCGLLSGGEYTPNEMIFGEKTYHCTYDPMRAVRTERWKLIANFEAFPWQEVPPDFWNNGKSYIEVAHALKDQHMGKDGYHPALELYDLENDPCEQRNLADDPQYKETRDELVQALGGWMKETEDPLLDGPMLQGSYRQRMKDFKAVAGV